jgi:uncharacterized protein (TIGR02598 family)
MSPLLRNHDRCEAFSLVEVVLSLGIVSFAILSTVALLPLGLATFHNSSEIYYGSQARQQILNNLQQAGIASLLVNNLYSETDYFDGEGSFLGTNATGAVYQDTVMVSAAPAAALPVVSNSSITSLPNAALVTTQFGRYLPGGTVTTSASSGGSTYRTGTDYISY